jgi:hypothetical protein
MLRHINICWMLAGALGLSLLMANAAAAQPKGPATKSSAGKAGTGKPAAKAKPRKKEFDQRVQEAVLAQLGRDTWDKGRPPRCGPGAYWPALLPENVPVPGDGDLALKVSIREFYACEAGQGGRQKWIRFDLEVSYADILPPLRAESLILWSDGSLDLGKEGRLLHRHPASAPFPLGPSGLALYGYEISYYPKQNRIAIETDLSTYPGEPKILRLRGKISVGLPPTRLQFDGKLMVAELVLGSISDAELSPQMVKGTLTVPGEANYLPLDLLLRTKAHFRFDRDGLTATGDYSFLKMFRKQLGWTIGWDGHGTFQSHHETQVLGLRRQSFLSTGFGLSLSQVHFHARSTAGVDLGPLQHELRLHWGAGKGPR